MRSKVHAGWPDGECDINAGIDEHARLAAALAHRVDHSPGELLEFSRGEVFLSKLDVVDFGERGFRNSLEQMLALFGCGCAVCSICLGSPCSG